MNLWKRIKSILVYQPIPPKEPFRLEEVPSEDILSRKKSKDKGLSTVQEPTYPLELLTRYSLKVCQLIQDTLKAVKNKDPDSLQEIHDRFLLLQRQYGDLKPIILGYRSTGDQGYFSTSLEENINWFKHRYVWSKNKDLILRKITLSGESPRQACLIYLDGLSDKEIINHYLLKPLMQSQLNISIAKDGNSQLAGMPPLQTLADTYLPTTQALIQSDIELLETSINAGDAVLLIDGINEALVLDTRGREHRSISQPVTEQTVRGSQEALNEVLRVSISQIRSLLRASDLVAEMITVGERANSQCAILYINSIANPNLVEEVKRRIESIQVDFISEGGALAQYIVDYPYNPFPQTLSTERPDRVAASLTEGRIAVLMEGAPYAYILPIQLISLFETSEDFALNTLFASFSRLIRLSAAFLTLVLPSFYLAISTFHQEAIPTELVLAISSARQEVPFPTWIEIIMMQGAFELIREGGLRTPGVLGTTIGIVGAIILGQAAVMAKIISPIMIIIVSVTGLASFTIPEYRLSLTFRLMNFAFLLLAANFGLVGLGMGLVLLIVYLGSMRTFGVDYLGPLAPHLSKTADSILRGPLFKMERRPDELNVQDPTRQPPISRKWTESNKGEN